MTIDESFNKEIFAELLEQAKGDRTINRFAKDVDVSAAHISRLLRGLLKTAPSPETIAKLSFKAQNGISYKDLMTSAGHILQSGKINIEIDNIDNISSMEHHDNRINLEKKMSQVVLSHLFSILEQNYKIIKEYREFDYSFDMVVELEDDMYSRLIFDFKYQYDQKYVYPTYTNIYGKLALYSFKSTDKIVIVINDKGLYEKLLSKRPKSLNMNLFVMLIDIESESVIEESKLCSFLN